MRLKLSILTFTILSAVLFSACNKVHDNTKYIPKDAAMVFGINSQSINKKVPLETLSDSKMLAGLKKNTTVAAILKDFDKTGISDGNIYSYITVEKEMNTARITILLPLGNESKWQTFINNELQQPAVRQAGNHKDASLPDNLYAGWDNEKVILIYLIKNNHNADTATVANTTAQAAAMDNAFNVTYENSIAENTHFKALAGKGHDVIMWINYDEIMNRYMENGGNNTGSLSMAGTLWKDAVMASWFDFENGKVNGGMQHYISDDLKDAAKEFGRTNADRDMIDRMPVQQMDMLMAMHLSPKALKAMLDKVGMLGLINVMLQQQNIDADFVLDAFTGDMAIAVNEATGTPADSTHNVLSNHTVTFALKLNKKENFDKLLSMATQGMNKIDNNTYAMQTPSGQSIYLSVNDKYAVVSNSQANVSGYLNNAFKGQKLPADADIYGHPFAMYADLQKILAGIHSYGSTPNDSLMLQESRNLFSSFKLNGGGFDHSAFSYSMTLNLVDAKQNSLLQLVNYGMRMQALSQQ